ncbi:hypothetical protein BV210_11635 [Halorientalis sp. IM1011]|nr:hypothetical protein BV210_11635 [Halorientalis sp. IM1011]
MTLVSTVTATTVHAPASRSPPNQTDHGLSNETFHVLWSGDQDDFVSPANATGPTERSPMAVLANGTDIPLDEPPAAVEQWNRGDLGDFPSSGRNQSVHPPNATLTDGTFLEDATANIFAVQPSTRARIQEGDQPLYVGPSGSLLGTVDYRLEIEEPTAMLGERDFWKLQSHEVTEVRLLVDGEVLTRQSGSQRVTVPFEDLDTYRSENLTLTLEADIQADLIHVMEYCNQYNRYGRACIDFDRERESDTETLTVRDSRNVTVYDLYISGFRTRYPDGDLGLVVYKNYPWLGHELPNGEVHGVWRFYSARDTEWDSLVTSSEDGQKRIPSPAQPLQVSAYPIETGPTPSPRANVTILETYGEQTQPGTLPDAINLDTLTEPYTASFGIATRTKTDRDPDPVVATGLVRGVTAERDFSSFEAMELSESNFTLEILDRDASTIRVKATLRSNATGDPVATSDRDGYVIIGGERFNTTKNGTVITTLPRGDGSIAGRYVPSFWWRETPGYLADSDAVYARGTVLEWFATLFRFAVPVSLFLVGVYLIDRITGWRVWPPWRGV